MYSHLLTPFNIFYDTNTTHAAQDLTPPISIYLYTQNCANNFARVHYITSLRIQQNKKTAELPAVCFYKSASLTLPPANM